MRAMLHSKLMLSPHEIVFGRPMWLRIHGDLPPAPPDVQTDHLAYFEWLSTELHHMHNVVKNVHGEIKLDDKMRYEKAHKVVIPA